MTIICTRASVLQLILGTIGYSVINSEAKVLGCAENGTQWAVLTKSGNSFITLHLIMILIHCAVCNVVLYRIPKKYDYFKEDPKEEDFKGEDQNTI